VGGVGAKLMASPKGPWCGTYILIGSPELGSKRGFLFFPLCNFYFEFGRHPCHHHDLNAPLCAALVMKSFTVPSSNLAKASVCVTLVMWFRENLKQNSSNSCA